ncbi:hypothetical protein [Streptomyces pactum]|uniref:hypothetical protein n=1 Tax=Streptomyces pactum TaxID=68249 RepID=UPI0036FACD1E
MRAESAPSGEQEANMSKTGDDALTTDDLAHPRHREAAAGNPQSERGPRSGPPVFPGEATGRPDASGAGAFPPSGTPGTAPFDGPAGTDGPATGGGRGQDDDQPLLGPGRTADLRTRWSTIQNDFVDDPRAAVRDADALVAEVMQTLAATFARHKQGLEEQWQKGGDVATEDLRLALQHYRSFFHRLLST